MIKHATLLFFTIIFSTCSVYIPPGYRVSDSNGWGHLPAESTVKVIQENINDRYLLQLEDALARNGYRVMGSNTLVQSVPVADYSFQTADTTVYRTDRRQWVTEVFPEKPADYVLRYRYSPDYNDGISQFSATVTNVVTGQVEATFIYDGTVSNPRVFREMVTDMVDEWK